MAAGDISNFKGNLSLTQKYSKEAISSVYGNINPNKRSHCFEIFGLDFMIDEEMKPWLIEINTNPCLELSSPLLSKIIPEMLDNAFKLAIDPLFPPPPISVWPANKRLFWCENPLEANKFELIVEEDSDLEEVYNRRIIQRAVFDEIREDDEESEIND